MIAKTGLLANKNATSNKRAFNWVKAQGPAKWIYESRWIWDGHFVSSSGVSAGMDMAIAVCQGFFGSHLGESIAKIIEYSPYFEATDDPFAKLYKL